MKDIMTNRVLRIFEKLNTYPRESGNEKAVSDYIAAWAAGKGFEVTQDEYMNLIIRKPATDGYEDRDPVILQAHMDMVCEKNSDSSHDFSRDHIALKVEGDWLMSDCGTSLGADDGIGVAAAMAILEDEDAQHPALEVVFTVEEETSFAGAENVDISTLKATRMINLDHACENEVIAGSCGGTGVEFTMPLERCSDFAGDAKAYRITVTGLMGGHSGEDIHRGRGNAITLLIRLLENPAFKVVSISGGTNRLAIPREASAVVLAESREAAVEAVNSAKASFRREYGAVAPDLDIIIGDADFAPPLTDESFAKIAAAVRLYPNGIVSMNGSFENTVESSDNIGIISTEGDVLSLTSEIRGAYRTTVDSIAATIDALAGLLGAEVRYFNGYVPWEYKDESAMKELAIKVYGELRGETMNCIALHAGLECGFFAEKKPELDIISIGPDCIYFHSPQERASIPSILRFYDFLKELLRQA